MMTGAEIQIEEGNYSRIHNAILEVLAKARLSGSEFRCIHFLLRKTYGWGKKEDRISLSQWAEGTDTKRPHVLKTLNMLIEKNIIYRRIEGGQVPFYGFNKYIEEWKGIGVDSQRGERFKKEEVLPEQVTVTRAGNSTVTNTGNKTVTYLGTHKRKKEILKESSPKKNASVHKQMFGQLVDLCHVDAGLKRGQLNKTVKQLVDSGYTPADLAAFGEWWEANDFRGKRGEPPTIGQVGEKIRQAKDAAAADRPAAEKQYEEIWVDGELRLMEVNA